MKTPSKQPRILTLDIETAPNLAHVWGLWKQTVNIQQIVSPGYVLSWAAKWHGQRGVGCKDIRDDGFLSSIHTLLDEADWIVTWNGKKFDIPQLNRQFLLEGMHPPSPYKHIDLLQTSRSQFFFPSNKLDYVSQELLGENKHKHGGWELWIGCMAGDNKCWKEMRKYNKKDVVLTERLYDVFMPYLKQAPNAGLYGEGGHVCPRCGSVHVQKRGLAHTQALSYQRYQCTDCGAWSRGRKSLEKKDTLANV